MPVLTDLARSGDARVTRLDALTTLARLLRFSDPPPSDPDAPEGTALLGKIERLWITDGPHLRFDEPSRTYKS